MADEIKPGEIKPGEIGTSQIRSDQSVGGPAEAGAAGRNEPGGGGSGWIAGNLPGTGTIGPRGSSAAEIETHEIGVGAVGAGEIGIGDLGIGGGGIGGGGIGGAGMGGIGTGAGPSPVSSAQGMAHEEATASPGLMRATRAQRLAFIAGVLVVGWLALVLFASVLAPFVAAAVLAYALDPPTTRLTRIGLARGAAAAVMVLALIAGLLLFALLLYPLLLLQIKLLATRIPQYAFLLQGWASEQLTHLQENFGSDVVNDKLRDLVSGQAASLLSVLLSTATGVVTSGFAIFNVLTLAIITPILGFYFLRDWPKMIAIVASWVPRRYNSVIMAQAREVDRILSAWVRGQAMCCLILAFFYATGLTAAGLDLGLIVGLSAGMLSFIPYVGSVSGGVTAIGLALAQFQTWQPVGVVVGVLIAGQILEGYVIYPRFLGDRVELPAVWVIFSLFAGGAAFGFVGVMLAVPVAATIGVLVRFWLRRYLASPLYSDPPADATEVP